MNIQKKKFFNEKKFEFFMDKSKSSNSLIIQRFQIHIQYFFVKTIFLLFSLRFIKKIIILGFLKGSN